MDPLETDSRSLKIGGHTLGSPGAVNTMTIDQHRNRGSIPCRSKIYSLR
jgi:hypothetical protein